MKQRLITPALVVGSMRPDLALYVWLAVLTTPLLAPYLTRRLSGT